MTVLVEQSSSTFTGSGNTGPFTWTWRFLSNSHISVTKTVGGVETLLVEGVDYTLTGASSYQGGRLVLASSLAAGQSLYVKRNTDRLQGLDLRNQKDFAADAYEDALDKKAMILQDDERERGALRELIDSAFEMIAQLAAGGSALLENFSLIFRPLDIITKGPWVDARAFDSFEEAVAAASTSSKALMFSVDQNLTSNIVIPANVELVPLNGAKINHGAFTISYAGSTARWPLAQVFNGTGAVTGLKESRPEYFGAAGNGVADDYAAINAAIIAASGTGRVILRKGAIYSSASRISVPSGIHITGGGTIKALPLGSSGTVQGFLYGDALTNVTIDGIKIDCNPANQTHPLLAAVYITGSTNVKFVNNEVVCSYSGVYVRASSSNVVVAHNVFDNSYGSSIDPALQHGPSIIVGANDSSIIGNNVTGIMSTEAIDSFVATGIYAGSDTGVTYRNITVALNTVRYSYTAVAVSNVNGLSVVGNILSDCRTKNHSQAVLLTACKGANVSVNAIRNIDYTAIGLMDCMDSVVSGNTISNDVDFLVGTNTDANKCNGITVSQTANGLSKNNSVTGNVITVGGSNASASYSALLVYGDGSVVANNKVEAQAVSVSYGLQFSGENFMISNNTLLVSYMAMRPLTVAGWTVTKNNVIENNIISGVTNSIYDTSAGPNRYISNTILQGTQTYSNPHYRSSSDSRTVTLQKTVDYTLALADGGIAFVGSSAGTVKFTLPSATTAAGYSALGLTYRFSRIFAQAVRIAPQAGETIRGGGVSKYLELTGYGSVEVTCLTSGVWEITKSTGTTAFEP